MMTRQLRQQHGFTLIEIILVLIITGIVATIAMRGAIQIADTARIEQTKQQMLKLEQAIAGNPDLSNNGVRSDFGYVGDVGAMPPNLDALYSNPGTYTTWNGPYIRNQVTQIADDFKKDAWRTDYIYSGGTTITSTGSGSNIIKRVASSESNLLRNGVSGNIYDLDGTPPGTDYEDSVTITLSIPNGSGSNTIKSTTPDRGGYFSFDSIPIGNHDLTIIYEPDDDTINRFVSVLPGSDRYCEYRLSSNVWNASAGGGGGGGGSVVYVSGSAYSSGGHHDHMGFDIRNESGSSITISSIVATYTTSPASFYTELKWDGTQLWKDDHNQKGTTEVLSFSGQAFAAGATVTVELKKFRRPRNGHTKFDIRNTDFTVTFSNGDAVTFTTPAS